MGKDNWAVSCVAVIVPMLLRAAVSLIVGRILADGICEVADIVLAIGRAWGGMDVASSLFCGVIHLEREQVKSCVRISIDSSDWQMDSTTGYRHSERKVNIELDS